MLTFATLALGLVMLLSGGAMLVRGASEIAGDMGVSPMVVGLTVVGFGTSAPELVVNAVGVTSGATDVAFGNVVGSNISNFALVLGMVALMAPITIQGNIIRREIPLLLLATTVLTVVAMDGVFDGSAAVIDRSDAVVMFLMFLVFLYITILSLYDERAKDPLLVELKDYALLTTRDSDHRFRWLYAGGGIALLFTGGQLTIDGAVGVAEALQISGVIIGLFVVAIGTSLPELVTSIIAASRNESDLALGNVVGSNLFNTTIVLPVSAALHPVTVPAGGVLDLTVSWLLAAMLIPVFYLGVVRLGKAMGVVLVLGYFAYALLRISVVAG